MINPKTIRGSHNSHAILSKKKATSRPCSLRGDGFKIGRQTSQTGRSQASRSATIARSTSDQLAMPTGSHRPRSRLERCRRRMVRTRASGSSGWTVSSPSVWLHPIKSLRSPVRKPRGGLDLHPDIVEQTVHTGPIAYERHAGLGWFGSHHRSRRHQQTCR